MTQIGLRLVAYRRAQMAIAELKAAVQEILATAGEEGLKNSQVGRALGVYQGHVGHEGHISRTLLQMLQADGIAEQTAPGGRWKLRNLLATEAQDE